MSTHDDENITQTSTENLENCNDQDTEKKSSESIESIEISEQPSLETITEECEKVLEPTDENESPQIAVTKILSATQIDDMFQFNQQKENEEEGSAEEPFDLNPQVNIEDMKGNKIKPTFLVIMVY